MRFDVEIPPYNIDICYIKDSKKILGNLAPIYYVNINTVNKVPADFITYDGNYADEVYNSFSYELVNGPFLDNVKSSKFILTNISKFSTTKNTKIPLFYKHHIPSVVKLSNIRIEDYYGSEISKEDYLVDYDETGTLIYMNKVNKILFVRYITSNVSKKVLLNLNPVFQEAVWSDIDSEGKLKAGTYIYRDGAIDTTYNGELYIAYIDNKKIFRPPLGNIEDEWFVGILNTTIKSGSYTYTIPEYYNQGINTDGKYKYIEFKKCQKIYGKYVRSQYNIYDKTYDDIYLYIKDTLSGKIKYAFTYNQTKIGTIYKDSITYGELKNYTNDGIIESPIAIEDTDEVYTSHYTVEEYYEYNLLDIKSSNKNRFCYYAIFIMPNITEGRSVFHAIIGDANEENDGETYFSSFGDYETFIAANNYYHVGIFNLYFKNDDIELLDVREDNPVMLNKKDIAELSADMFYYDVINRNIDIPTNDSLLITLDLARLQDDGIISTDSNNITTSESNDYIRALEDNVIKTLHASTKPIFELIRKK